MLDQEHAISTDAPNVQGLDFLVQDPQFIAGLAADLAIIREAIENRARAPSAPAGGCGCTGCGSEADKRDAVQEALESDSRRLDPADRRRFEALFETSLAKVRIHVGGPSSVAVRQLGIPAFTVGRDMVFDEDHFHPGTPAGDALIAHELTHVLQQRAGRSGPVRAGTGARLELQALSVERRFERGIGPNLPILAAPVILQMANPIIVKCGSICPEVFLDPSNGVPCGLADCEILGFFPTVIATSYCVYRCAVNKYGAFIINTRFGPMGPFFTGKRNAN